MCLPVGRNVIPRAIVNRAGARIAARTLAALYGLTGLNQVASEDPGCAPSARSRSIHSRT